MLLNKRLPGPLYAVLLLLVVVFGGACLWSTFSTDGESEQPTRGFSAFVDMLTDSLGGRSRADSQSCFISPDTALHYGIDGITRPSGLSACATLGAVVHAVSSGTGGNAEPVTDAAGPAVYPYGFGDTVAVFANKSAIVAELLEEIAEKAAMRQLPYVPNTLDFTLRKLGSANGNTLMVVGGIQGDEPGAFSAAALVASHYKITRGAVWVVPDLNMASILKRKRGAAGDMNRKFAELKPDDPDYDIVRKIKSVLLNDQVNLVLNLHDGSGFYRPVWESRKRNPNRWGQSLIIDQEAIYSPPFNLYETAIRVEGEVNSRLLDPMHRYHINNTLTAEGNEEMAKTLSFFAVCNGKPAFGVEASKELGTEFRSYYHLQIIEAFMRELGIEFERDFELTPSGVLAAINSRLTMAVYDNKMVFPLENIRPNLNALPFKKGSEPDVRASKPLLALVPELKKDSWRIAYGNRTLTRMKPQFMDFDDSLDELEMEVDGRLFTVSMGEVVPVRESFLVRHVEGYRVNAIGAQKEKNGSEADVLLIQRDFAPRFSLDREGSIYRVEIYKENAFAGMVLVRFGKGRPISERPLTATSGPESSLGF